MGKDATAVSVDYESTKENLAESCMQTRPLWKRLLFGFWPCLTMLIICVIACISVTLHFGSEGLLGFYKLRGCEATESKLLGRSGLLVFRSIAALATVRVPGGIALKAPERRRTAKMNGTELPLGGFELFCTFTIWTWTLGLRWPCTFCN